MSIRAQERQECRCRKTGTSFRGRGAARRNRAPSGITTPNCRAGLGARVFGLSTQTTPQQAEAAARLHLPFALLSDTAGELARALRLPTFEVEGQRLLRRVTLIVRGGTIEKVFYPVFPPDQNAQEVLNWLQQQA